MTRKAHCKESFSLIASVSLDHIRPSVGLVTSPIWIDHARRPEQSSFTFGSIFRFLFVLVHVLSLRFLWISSASCDESEEEDLKTKISKM